MPGYIKLFRDIQYNEIWQEKPFSPGQAWVDLLLMANHEDKKILFDSNLIEVKRGSFITSIRKLCEKWGWSNTKVVKFLTVLKNDEMIAYFSDKKKTLITIVNYGFYQDSNDDKTSQKRHRNDTETTLKHTNKNIKNEKNEKNIYISPQLETSIEDFKEYRKKIKKPMTDRAVELLIDKLNKLASDDETKIAILNQSIVNGWQGVFPLKHEQADKKQPQYKSAAELREERYKKAQEEAMRILREQGVISDDGEGSEQDS